LVVALVGSASAAVTANLEHHFRFDNSLASEVSGDTTTMSVSAGSATYAGGQIVSAFDCNGANTLLSSAAISSIADSNPTSISLWVRLDGLSSTRGILAVGTATVSRSLIELAVTAAGELQVQFGLIAATTTTSGLGLTADASTWHHVVLTSSGTAQVLYADGSSVATPSNTLATVSTTMSVCKGVATTAVFNGLIDDLAVHSVELSSADVTSIYNDGLASVSASGVSYAAALLAHFTLNNDVAGLTLASGTAAFAEGEIGAALQREITDAKAVVAAVETAQKAIA